MKKVLLLVAVLLIVGCKDYCKTCYVQMVKQPTAPYLNYSIDTFNFNHLQKGTVYCGRELDYATEKYPDSSSFPVKVLICR